MNGSCDFIWQIFAVDVGGAALDTDTDSDVPVRNGLFTAVINVTSSVIDGNARFLEVQVRCPAGSGDYTLLTPRKELQATPYALGLHLPLDHTTSNASTELFSISNTSAATSNATIQGSSAGGDGVRGLSTGTTNADNGVYGETNSTNSSEAGVKGVSTDTRSFGGYFSNSTTTTSGGAIYAKGDAKQSLAAGGFVKAGAYVDCSKTNARVIRSFNNVNTVEITASNGSDDGHCNVDFGFRVSDRFVTALAWGTSSEAFIVTYQTFDLPDDGVLYIFRHKLDGNGEDGGVMIVIY